MKKSVFNIIGAAAAAVMLAACSADDFSGASQRGVPNIADYQALVVADQSNNTVTMTLVDANGNMPKDLYPIWELKTTPSQKSTTNGFVSGEVYIKGDYVWTCKVGNANGVSDGELTGTVTINETSFDFNAYLAEKFGTETFTPSLENLAKRWRVHKNASGHIALGPGAQYDEETGEFLKYDCNSWWAAKALEKEANTLYDDTFTIQFTSGAGGTYSYDPVDGLTFVRTVTTIWGPSGGDWDAPVVASGGKTNANFGLDYNSEMDVMTINLPAETVFPWICDDNQYKNPCVYYVIGLTEKTLTLGWNADGMGLQMILHDADAEEDVEPEDPFDPDAVDWADVDSEDNLGINFNPKPVIPTTETWFADPSWQAYPVQPELVYEDGVYTLTTLNQTYSEWQGQCTIKGIPATINPDQKYDLSVNIGSTQALGRVTIKVCADAKDDPTIFCKNDIALEAGDNLLRFGKFVPDNEKGAFPCEKIKFILDIGGAPAGVTVSISNIILQKHKEK